MSLLWVLNLSDGCHSLLDIAERAGYEFNMIKNAAKALRENGLLMDTEQ
jgi:aminopeptidase-like protein